jgi:hypothetical protein
LAKDVVREDKFEGARRALFRFGLPFGGVQLERLLKGRVLPERRE